MELRYVGIHLSRQENKDKLLLKKNGVVCLSGAVMGI